MMEKPFPWLEMLSSIIVEVSKKLEMKKEPITKETVIHILENDPSLIPSDLVEATQNVNVRSSHIKLIQELEEEQKKTIELFRSTITVLSPFLQFSNMTVVSKRFEELKEKLQDTASIDHLEKAVKALKETVIQYDIKPEEPKKGIKKLMGIFHRGDQDFLSELKPVISELIMILDPLVSEIHREKWTLLKESLWVTKIPQDIKSWTATLTEFLGNIIAQVNQERKELNEFISELGQNLVEIEKNIMASLDHFHSSQEMASQFSYHLDGQINDLRQSINTTSNLEELRKILITKLSYIKQVLEKRRSQEEEYNKELEERIHKLQKELATINDQIKQVQFRERRLAEEILKDPLTGIANRRAYEARIAEEWERFKRYGHIFSVAVFDLDHFKKVNDVYGHKAGDLVLKEIARLVKSSIRKADLIARYGGEEFVIIFTGTNAHGAKEATEKVRQIIESTKFVFKKQEVPITISAGVSQVEPSDKSPIDVFERADKALYISKKGGRNKVSLFQESDQELT
ncbi:MAG: diguanylate cyclase [Syntrophobacterales bacterium]|nr:diguanylate cyclase [Syntrophobacterales bacterium]